MASTRKPRILIVEDNPGDILLFRLALEGAGLDCDIHEIHDGRAAMDFIKTPDVSRPDLVVLDLNLPKASGNDILATLRATPDFKAVPVVIWTSSRARVDRAHVDALGVTEYFVKPTDLRDMASLGSTIKEVIRRALVSE